MAAVAEANVAAPVPAHVVGNAFVQQYYQILHRSPELVHRFYQDISILGRPEDDGSLSVTTTMDEINAKILSLSYDDFRFEIRSVDAQESLNSGVSVLVTGYMTGKDNIVKNFAQSFFLSPQEKGFFVLNDIFRYIENASNYEVADHGLAEDAVAPATTEQEPQAVLVQENNVQEKSIPDEDAAITEEAQSEKIVHVDNGEVPTVEEDAPVPEVVNEEPDSSELVVPDSSQLVIESGAKIEESPKKSYASIVLALKQNGLPFSSPAPAQRKPQPRKPEQHVNKAPTSTIAYEPVPSNMAAVEIDSPEEEGYSVYVKGLPMSATPAVVEEEFKKFGTIKHNGIQVRSNKGFCFGFVEFEAPDAAQKAIEASPILISGRNTVVEEKRSTISRGGNRGRFTGGRGTGFTRNDSMRSRGSYGSDDSMRGRGSFTGGRGFSRGGDFGGNRNDYGFRNGSRGGGGGGGGGPSSNRGGDGYQRDHNSGRVNRGPDATNGASVNTSQ